MKHLEWQNCQYYEFGPFRLAPGEHRLYRDGEVILLPPKEFDLLLLLVQNPGQVMNRENLIKALWPNTVVEEANLNVHISALRKALAESHGEQHYIETLPRLGYRFIAPVTEVNETEAVPSSTPVYLINGPKNGPANGANSSNLNAGMMASRPEVRLEASPIAAGAGAKDWYSRHRLAAVTLPLWLLAVGLLGILATLFFKSFRVTPTDSAAGSPFNVVPLTTYPGRELQPAFS